MAWAGLISKGWRSGNAAAGGCPLSPCGPWACARGLCPRLAYFLVRFGGVSWRTEGGCSSSHQPTLNPCRYRPAFCARVLRDLADYAATMHRRPWLSPMNCFGVTLRREHEWVDSGRHPNLPCLPLGFMADKSRFDAYALDASALPSRPQGGSRVPLPSIRPVPPSRVWAGRLALSVWPTIGVVHGVEPCSSTLLMPLIRRAAWTSLPLAASHAGVDGSLPCLPGKSLGQRMGLSCCSMSISYTRLSGGMPCRELSKASRSGARSCRKNVGRSSSKFSSGNSSWT